MAYRLDAPLDELMDMARARYDVAFEPMTVGGMTVEILQITNMREHLDKLVPGITDNALKELPLWAKIWPAAVVLGHFLRHLPLQEKSLLEVGAGCGVTGLLAARHGCRQVILSDVDDDALLFSKINVLQNGLGNQVSVERIDITGPALKRRFDYIVGAEILYLESLHRPLHKFLKRHLATTPGAEAVLSKSYLRKAKKFFKLAERDFRLQERTIGSTSSDNSGDERALLTVHRLQTK